MTDLSGSQCSSSQILVKYHELKFTNLRICLLKERQTNFRNKSLEKKYKLLNSFANNNYCFVEIVQNI